MPRFIRSDKNPFLVPNRDNSWEALATFNPCVVNDSGTFHLLYRAQSAPKRHQGVEVSLSSIGYAESDDGVNFQQQRQLVLPQYEFEKFGCEDPRVTKLDDKYYIFYTALSAYPFSADGIRVGVAVTKDFKTLDAKHAVTPFNSKAMALFPERINGKMAAILTVHTDIRPAKIAIAYFDHEAQIWSESYWAEWYSSLDAHVIPLLRSQNDQLEVGAPPIKTDRGWLLIYAYIENYASASKTFGIEAVLLDTNNPNKVLGRTTRRILEPEKDYEKLGDVPNVVFPSGATLEGSMLSIYYGAADTTCCVAKGDVNELLDEMIQPKVATFAFVKSCPEGELERYLGNPIIAPRPEFAWEAKATFNPGVIYEGGKVHLVYRAMDNDGTSVFGYASSSDGVHIDERLHEPIYVPRERFERKSHPGNSGCEDPRLTRIGDDIYVFYTAYDGFTPRVAFSSIKVTDFLNHRWSWTTAKVITGSGAPDKDACLLPEKIDDKYVIFHRPGESISISFVDDLRFEVDEPMSSGLTLLKPSASWPHIEKFGMAGPPLKTSKGWLMIYHWVTDSPKRMYEIGATMLNLGEAEHMISDKRIALLKPETAYEKVGQVSDVVFSCGAAILQDCLFLYYGGADTVIGVARVNLETLLKKLGA